MAQGTSPLQLANQNARDVLLLFSKWLHASQFAKGPHADVPCLVKDPGAKETDQANPPKGKYTVGREPALIARF